MAMVVQHNLTAMNANRMLGVTTSAQAKSTEKLSSGYRINRAADDAAGLSISEKMRKQIRGLDRASANAQDGISAVQTAEGALTEVHSMLQRMNELAVQAANGTNSESDRQSIQDEINQLTDEIDRVSETTKFNETYLLKGDKSGVKATDYQYKPVATLTTDLQFVNDDGKVDTVKAGTYIGALDTAKYDYYTEAGLEKVGSSYTAATQFTTTTAVITATDYYQMDDNGDFIAVASGSIQNTGDYYTVSFTTDGTIGAATKVTSVATATGYVANTDVYDKNGTLVKKDTSFGTTVAATEYFATYGNGYYSTNATPVDATLANYTTSAKTQLQDAQGNEIAENGLYSYFDENGYKGGLYKSDGSVASATDVANYVDDSKQMKTGALELKFHVGADATGNNQIAVSIEAMSAESLGVDGLSVTGTDDTNARNAIETISAALAKVSEQRSALGAVQNRLEHTIANLDNIAENTTSAESQIRDTDMAEEMVNYSKNNILAQAGQSMLAQANQSNQGVLSLLG